MNALTPRDHVAIPSFDPLDADAAASNRIPAFPVVVPVSRYPSALDLEIAADAAGMIDAYGRDAIVPRNVASDGRFAARRTVVAMCVSTHAEATIEGAAHRAWLAEIASLVESGRIGDAVKRVQESGRFLEGKSDRWARLLVALAEALEHSVDVIDPAAVAHLLRYGDFSRTHHAAAAQIQKARSAAL